MIWRDILIETLPDDRELRRALAHVLQVEPDEVALFTDYVELLQPMPDTIRVICERILVNGEIHMKLGIMPVHPDQEARVRASDDLALRSALCTTLATRGLIDDGSDNPYAFLLLDRGGSASRATVDADRLDIDDPYVVTPYITGVWTMLPW
jgi:hypothetical protein